LLLTCKNRPDLIDSARQAGRLTPSDELIIERAV
jgi:hypothetical protein